MSRPSSVIRHWTGRGYAIGGPSRRGALARFAANHDGGTLVGFALVLPVLLLLTLGAFDFAYLMFEQDRVTDATRRGLRAAIMGTPLGNLSTLPVAPINCSSTGGSVTCGGGTGDPAAFSAILAEMKAIKPEIDASNVKVTYTNSGLGAAESGGTKPFITVSVTNLQHEFMMISAFPGMPSSITMPDFATTGVSNPVN